MGSRSLFHQFQWKITLKHNLCMTRKSSKVNMGATCDKGEKSLVLNQHFYDNVFFSGEQ